MPTYTAPVKDSLFNLNEVLNLSQYADLPGFDTIDADTLEAILGEGGKFCAEVLFPLNHSGDQQGCTRHEDGSVTTPDGFSYSGQWQAGEMTGLGVATYPGGDRYEGNFAKGKREGQGKLTYATGEVAEGMLLADALAFMGSLDLVIPEIDR